MQGTYIKTLHCPAELVPANRPGYWKVRGLFSGETLEGPITSRRVCELFPQHADAIRNRPDSSD